MRIASILNEKEITLSCEVFPPKHFDGIAQASAVAQEIAGLHPSFMSVTYGAAGSTPGHTIAVAKAVAETGVTPLCHLTCVQSTREHVQHVLADMKTAEGHPESGSRAKDMDYLRRKVDAGVDFLTTQMFFDNGLLYNFLYRMQRAGMVIPVCAGIMPICDARQVARVVKLSGSIMPPRFAAIADRFAGDPQAMTQAGIAFATEQIVDLVANGVGHIHLYTMNKPWIARAIVENLSSIIKLEAGKDATSAN